MIITKKTSNRPFLYFIRKEQTLSDKNGMGILEVLERLENKYGLDFYELTKSKNKGRQEFLKRARKNGLELIFNAITDNIE